MSAPARAPRSKTIATWAALLGGTLGAHRLYLHGPRDPWAWAFWPPTLAGLWGVARMRSLGQDDQLAWALIPLLGLSISAAMLSAIVIGLTADQRWAGRFGVPGQPPRPSGWGVVLAVVAALMLGGASLMGTLAFGGQKYFEWQRSQADAEAAPRAAAR
ncbi:hypothetical protein [Ideonella sp.]|uniref:hypothetical protein n=1 Tax=Ideonella sp. TaxID=1929293 RepID=UPI0035B38A58